MLTLTVRQLERDGLVRRTVYPVVPPRVEYALTPLGESLLQAVEPLVAWTRAHRDEIAIARTVYDDTNVTVTGRHRESRTTFHHPATHTTAIASDDGEVRTASPEAEPRVLNRVGDVRQRDQVGDVAHHRTHRTRWRAAAAEEEHGEEEQQADALRRCARSV